MPVRNSLPSDHHQIIKISAEISASPAFNWTSASLNEELREASERGRDVLTSETYEIVNLVEAGDLVACEVLWRGVVAVPIRTLQPGNAMKAHFGVFFEFQGDKIRRQRNYDCFEPF